MQRDRREGISSYELEQASVISLPLCPLLLLLLSLSPHLISTGSLSRLPPRPPPLLSSRLALSQHDAIVWSVRGRETGKETRRRNRETRDTASQRRKGERKKGKGCGCGGVPGRRCSSACRIALLASLPSPIPALSSPPYFLPTSWTSQPAAFRSSERRGTPCSFPLRPHETRTPR